MINKAKSADSYAHFRVKSIAYGKLRGVFNSPGNIQRILELALARQRKNTSLRWTSSPRTNCSVGGPGGRNPSLALSQGVGPLVAPHIEQLRGTNLEIPAQADIKAQHILLV